MSIRTSLIVLDCIVRRKLSFSVKCVNGVLETQQCFRSLSLCFVRVFVADQHAGETHLAHATNFYLTSARLDSLSSSFEWEAREYRNAAPFPFVACR